jgi:hypothetical protein
MISESTAWIVLALFAFSCLFASWYAWTDKTSIYQAHKLRKKWIGRAWRAYRKSVRTPMTEEEMAEWQPYSF